MLFVRVGREELREGVAGVDAFGPLTTTGGGALVGRLELVVRTTRSRSCATVVPAEPNKNNTAANRYKTFADPFKTSNS